MERVYLTYLGHCMEIPQGDSIVGRGVSCRMRFNDPSLSRVHCRLRVHGTLVTVSDLNSTNGTLVNGRRVEGPTELKNADKIQIGDRELTVVIGSPSALFDESTVTYEEGPPSPDLPAEDQQRCPECKSAVSSEDDYCRSCGYTWADFRPGAVTQNVIRVTPDTIPAERRRHARHRVRVPVVYAAGETRVETVVISLSRGGAFVCTQSFDAPGTPCELTLMADGAPALTFRGRVIYALDKPEEGHQLGVGIEFVELGQRERRWLDETIASLGTP